MEHDIPFGNSNRENGPTFLDFPLSLGIFQWDEPTKRVPFTAEPEIPEIFTKWKAPSDCFPVPYRAFSRDVTAAILVFQNNGTAAVLVYQDNPVGVKLFSYVKTFFCSNKLA